MKNHYWAWVKFELDKQLNRGIWTLIIKPHEDLTCDSQEFLTTVFFAVENAPREFISEGNKFELFCGHGDNIKAKGEVVEGKGEKKSVPGTVSFPPRHFRFTSRF